MSDRGQSTDHSGAQGPGPPCREVAAEGLELCMTKEVEGRTDVPRDLDTLHSCQTQCTSTELQLLNIPP